MVEKRGPNVSNEEVEQALSKFRVNIRIKEDDSDDDDVVRCEEELLTEEQYEKLFNDKDMAPKASHLIRKLR